MTEMTDKLYPTLPAIREDPTAPPVVNGGTDDRGHQYRLKYIQDIQRFFEEEIKQRQAFSKKYFRIAKIINIVDNGLITVTIGAEGVGAALLATGAGAPVALALGIGGAVTGLISLMGNIFNKKATTKAEKHLKISQTAIVVYIWGVWDSHFHPFSPIYHHFSFLNQHQDHFSKSLKNLKQHSYIIQLIK